MLASMLITQFLIIINKDILIKKIRILILKVKEKRNFYYYKEILTRVFILEIKYFNNK